MKTRVKKEDFEKIYQETYNRTIRHIVIKCNNIEDVNDVIQDTYVELLKILKKKKVLQIENMQMYLLGIANNIIRRHYHRKKKEKIVEIYNENDNNIEIKDTFDIEEEFITKENVKEVWNYIKNKDLLTTKIFYLYFVLELKISEISEELNISESNVKNKIYRTLKEIQKYLEKDVRNNV